MCIRDRLEALKESYFQVSVSSAGSSTLNEGVEVEEEKKAVSTDSSMAQYAKTISQTLVK